MRHLLVAILLILPFHKCFAQNTDSLTISRIFTYSLEQGKSYERLRYLSESIGNRLSGSANAGAYQDEICYCAAELERRRRGGRREAPPARVL